MTSQVLSHPKLIKTNQPAATNSTKKTLRASKCCDQVLRTGNQFLIDTWHLLTSKHDYLYSSDHSTCSVKIIKKINISESAQELQRGKKLRASAVAASIEIWLKIITMRAYRLLIAFYFHFAWLVNFNKTRGSKSERNFSVFDRSLGGQLPRDLCATSLGIKLHDIEAALRWRSQTDVGVFFPSSWKLLQYLHVVRNLNLCLWWK